MMLLSRTAMLCSRIVDVDIMLLPLCRRMQFPNLSKEALSAEPTRGGESRLDGRNAVSGTGITIGIAAAQAAVEAAEVDGAKGKAGMPRRGSRSVLNVVRIGPIGQYAYLGFQIP
jgi:hypothetical protein